MNRLFNFGLILTIFAIISCGNKSNKETQEVKISDFTKTYEGTLSNEYEIIMTLSKSSSQLSGTYTYKSQGIPMKISGTMDDLGNFTLNEFNSKGSMTGVFKGQLTAQNLTGNWSKPDGSRTMPFLLMETANKESSFAKQEPKKPTTWKDDWTGLYEDKYGNTLSIKGPSTDGAVKFEIDHSMADGCEGSGLTGTAYLTKSWLANYYEEKGTCGLSFTYNSDFIEIMDYECGDYQGMSCGTFDGFYNRKK